MSPPAELEENVGLEGEISGVHDEPKGDEPKDDDPKGPNGADALNAMIGTMNEMSNAMKGVSDRIAQLEEGNDPPAPVVIDDDDPVDLDMMSNADLVGYILKEFKKELGPIGDRMQLNEDTTLRNNAAVEVDRLTTKHDDFLDFKDEMKVELTDNNSLTIEQAYKLAKVNNPEKVLELEKRQAEAEPPEPDEPTFGGLLPTSGITRKSTRMKQADAALDAWDEIFGGREIANP